MPRRGSAPTLTACARDSVWLRCSPSRGSAGRRALRPRDAHAPVASTRPSVACALKATIRPAGAGVRPVPHCASEGARAPSRSDRELARAGIMPMHRAQRVRPSGGWLVVDSGCPHARFARRSRSGAVEREPIAAYRASASRRGKCCDRRLACSVLLARAPGRARCLRLSLGSGVPSSSTNAHSPRHLAP
jgi:hypothetical protein